jgi:hypothetical protein
MPEIKRLGTKNRKALLACIEKSVAKWHRLRPGRDLRKATMDRIYTKCSQRLGLE